MYLCMDTLRFESLNAVAPIFCAIVLSVGLCSCNSSTKEISEPINQATMNSTEESYKDLPEHISANEIVNNAADNTTYSNDNFDIEIAAAEGEEVYSAYDGIVMEVNDNNEEGHCITIYHGNDLESEYCNLKTPIVAKGQSVLKGQVIGYVGDVGKVNFKLRNTEE